MGKVIQYGGWAVALALFLYSAFLTSQLTKSRDALSTVDHTGVMKEPAIERAPAHVMLEEKLRETEAKLTEANALLAEASQADSPVLMEEAPEVPEAVSDDGNDDEEANDAEPSQQERIAQAQAGAMVDMIYGDLFAELGLTPEQAAPFKEAMAANMLKEQKLMQGAFASKDRTAKSVRAERLALEASLRAKLTDVLIPEELTAYDNYEPVADQILYEKLVEGQLNMLASGLNEENRILTSQVVAEELVREIEQFDQSEDLYTMTNFNAAQARALHSSLDRMGDALDADQLALVDGFVTQALAVFDAMAENE